MKSDTIPPSDAVLVIVATFGLLLFGGAAIGVFLGYGIGLPLVELLVAVPALGYMLAKKINVRSYVNARMQPKTLLLGVAAGVAVLFFDLVISNLLAAIFGVDQAAQESSKIIINLASSSPGLFSVLITPILAGACEEFAFRGFLMNAIERKYSFIPALLISSLAFGLFHLDPQFIWTLAAFLIGLMLGYIYHRSHSLTVCATAHATVDMVAFAITLLIR